MELAHGGEPEGAVILAEEQSAGRGRAGRSWHSERGTGIYVTLLLRPKISPMQAPLLTMMAGLSAQAAIQVRTGLRIDLKWPNDLMLNGKKLGGILTEMYADTTLVRFVIVGIGINVNQEALPGELGTIATSLRAETGSNQSRLELLARLLREIESDYNRFLREGASSVTDSLHEGIVVCRRKESARRQRSGNLHGSDCGPRSGRTAAGGARRRQARDRDCGRCRGNHVSASQDAADH